MGHTVPAVTATFSVCECVSSGLDVAPETPFAVILSLLPGVYQSACVSVDRFLPAQQDHDGARRSYNTSHVCR